jgi:hypothetical protein
MKPHDKVIHPGLDRACGCKPFAQGTLPGFVAGQHQMWRDMAASMPLSFRLNSNIGKNPPLYGYTGVDFFLDDLNFLQGKPGRCMFKGGDALRPK